MARSHQPGRRVFLRAGAGTAVGLTLAFHLPAWSASRAARRTRPVFAPNAFIRIAPDDTVTVVVKHLEMGQGTYTGLPTLVAEELDADWAQVHVEAAPADAVLYNNLFWGGAQGTGGSTAMANSYEQLRRAGAAARAMLVAAAAKRWGVPAGEVRVAQGVVSHASGRKARFGELAMAAAAMPVPVEVKLKSPAQFRLIGKRVPRKDAREKASGAATYTSDVRLPGMLTALVAHPPLFGAKVKSYDAERARAVKGVAHIVEIPTGVAVLASTYWAATRARDALQIQWDETAAYRGSTADQLARYRALAATHGAVAQAAGDAEAAYQGASTRLEALYEFPYLAHAAMEPLNCVMHWQGDGCTVWNGEQLQSVDQANIAAVLGVPPERVRLNMLYAGGSFGRRGNPNSDYLVEAAHIVKAIQGRVPVKLQWTREDDMQGGYYRPLYVHALRAGLDDKGNVVSWAHRIVGQSIAAGTVFAGGLVKDGIDATSVEGASNLPYDIAHRVVELHTTAEPVPVQWWRSVGSSHTAFSTETFIDELAAAAGRDPVDFRRALLARRPRHLAVLELAAAKSGWGELLPRGHARGIALHESFGTCVAQVAEVVVGTDASFRVRRVVCAVDCGLAVNPDVVRAQMEGGIGYGLSAALHGAITLEQGRVQQSNFHDYAPLRIDEMPRVEVHIVPTQAQPTGVGEPGVPPIAPAVANALAAATGQRLRALPLRLKA